MEEDKYSVTCNNVTVAENCNLEAALMLVKAYFETYYLEKNTVMAIYRKEQ